MSRDITSAGSLSTEWLEVRNTGDYPLPPYSACEIVRSKRKDGRLLYSVQRVTQDGWREAVLITGPTQLEPGDYGVAARGPVLYCAVDPSAEAPQVDEEWGPEDGQTWLVQGTTGAKVTLEQTESGYVHMWRDAAAGGCEPANEVQWLVLFGAPTGGDVTITWTDPAGLGDIEVTVPFDATSGTIQTEIDGTVSDVADVTGGPLPTRSIRIEWVGDAARKQIGLPFVDYSALTGALTNSLGGLAYLEQQGRS